jgi:DNA-binding MarR family transcriptional regulator
MRVRKSEELAYTPETVRLGELEHGVGFFLRSARDASAQAFAQRAAHLGAGPGEYASLTVICENPGITQAALSAVTGRHMSTLTPILRRLQTSGFIARRVLSTDRRSSALEITSLGHERLRVLSALAAEHERELERIIGRARKPEFIRILRRIALLMP